MPTPDFTAGNVMDAAASLLNDTARTVFTYTVQIPYLKMSLQELREYLELSNSPVTNYADTVLAIPAGTTVISFLTTPALPTDLVDIRQAWERVTGTDPYTSMRRVDFIPNFISGETVPNFSIFAWLNNSMHVPASSQIIDLKLNYIQEIDNVVDENSQLTLINGKTFLQYRLGALLAEYVGENKARADALNMNAQSALDRTIGIETKGRQPISTRRKPFRSAWKRRGN